MTPIRHSRILHATLIAVATGMFLLGNSTPGKAQPATAPTTLPTGPQPAVQAPPPEPIEQASVAADQSSQQPVARTKVLEARARIPVGCEKALAGDLPGTCHYNWENTVSVGAGLPAVAFRFDRKIGVLDRVVPVEISLNWFQRKTWNPNTETRTGLVLWRMALGLTFSKPADGSDVVFGAYVMPWGIRVDSFAAGIGLGYQTAGELKSSNENWSIVLPLTYSFSSGG